MLLCAAAGPLSMAEVLRFCPSLAQKEQSSAVWKNHCCYVQPQPDFPLLRQHYAHSPEVRAVAVELMSERNHVLGTRSREQLAADARMALLEGDDGRFFWVLEQVEERPAYGWLRWAEHAAFWELLLGSQLAGAADVPIVPGTRSLRYLSFLRCAMIPPCCGELSLEDMPPMAQAALLLRHKKPTSIPELPALTYFMRGDWEAAHREFEKMYPPKPLLYRSLYDNLGAPLLIYAVMNAIQLGVGLRLISAWVDAAEAVLMNYVPSATSDDLQSFFDNLRVMDAVLNRGGTTAGIHAQLRGPLSAVPLILCRGALPAQVQQRIGSGQLELTLEYLEKAQLPLLRRSVAAAGRAFGLAQNDIPLRDAASLVLLVEQGETRWCLSCAAPDSSGHYRPLRGEDISADWLSVCPALAQGRVKLDDFSELLFILSRFQSAGLPLRFMGEKLHIYTPGEQQLSIRSRQERSGWFEIGADIKVAEELVLPLSSMLRSYPFHFGDFLPVGRNSYLHMSSTLQAQLQALSKVALNSRSGVRVPAAAVPGLAPLWQSNKQPQQWRRLVRRLQSPAAVPQGLQAKLRPYQLEGYRWLSARAELGLGACLADDMGLGKTLQAIALLLSCAEQGPSLVVAPLSLLFNWEEELNRFAPGLCVQRFRASEPLPKEASCLLLASYGQVVYHKATLAAHCWNLLILDEAQAIKNSRSQRFRTLRSLSARARVCLTGTPVENRLADLVSLMNFLNPSLPFAIQRGEEHVAALERLGRLAAPLLLRRTREKVLSELPPVSEQLHVIELSPRERGLYESYRRAAKEGNLVGGELFAILTRMRRLCCAAELLQSSWRGHSSKLCYMTELASELCAAGHRVLVFSQFTDVLSLAEERLQQLGLATLLLDGSTPLQERERSVQQFQTGQVPVFLLSLKVGGTGLNLTAADYVLLLDPWWNPAVEAQAAARSHRMGQQRPVTVCRLIAGDTLEERMLSLQKEKKELAESLFSEEALPVEKLLEIL